MNDDNNNGDDITNEIDGDLVRVQIDEELCIGAGICEMNDPNVFVLDDDEVISTVIAPGLMPRQRAVEAVDHCPGRAISIVEILDTDSDAE